MTEQRHGLHALWTDRLGRAATRSAQSLLVAALAGAVLWALTRVPLVLVPATIAVILASAIAPLVRWLGVHGWPRTLAVVTSFAAILGVFCGVVTGVVVLVRAQAHELAARFTAGIAQLHAFLNTGPMRVSDAQLEQARGTVAHFLTSGDIGTQAIDGARTAGEILAGAVLMAVVLFFLLKDGEEIRSFLIGLLPAGHRAKAVLAAERSAAVLGGYVRGTFLVAATDALIVGIALAIFQVPLALPLAVFIFIGGFIPIVGATGAGTLAVAVALVSDGPVTALAVLLVVVVANQLEHHFLQPILMGRVLRIHGLAILLALAAGTMLAGIVGALLAVPVTAVGWTVFKVWTGRGEAAPVGAAEVMAEEPEAA